MWIHVVIVLMNVFVVVWTTDEDVFAGIRKDLSLSKDSSNHTFPRSRVEEPEITSRKKKWVAPPGYYKKENKDARSLKSLKRKEPTLNEEQLQQLLNAKKQKKWKYPPNYFKKDVYIERHKQTLLKQDPKVHPEVAQRDAKEIYKNYIKQKVIHQSYSRATMKKAKEYVKSFDSDLAKTMRVRLSNSKVDWIARRKRWLKKGNQDLTNSDAEDQAHKQYSEKLEKDKVRKRERKHISTQSQARIR